MPYPSPLRCSQLRHATVALLLLLIGWKSLLRAQTTVVYASGETNTTDYTLTGTDNTFSVTTGSATQSGIISGTGSFQKIGLGTLSLTGNNAYTGGTTITAGSLNVGNSLSDTGSVLLDGGNLNLTADETIDSLSLVSGNISNRSIPNVAILTASSYLFANNSATTVGVILAGSGGLTKNGSGNLTLTRINTYTGGTTISAGTLTLFAGPDTLSDTGAVTINGGTLALNNTETVGALSLSAGNIIGSYTLTASSYTFTNNASATVSTALAGNSAALTKSGSGTLTLSGQNSFAGGITITDGLIAFNSWDNFGNGTVVLNGGGLQWVSGATTDISGRINPIGSLGAIFDTNGNDVAFAYTPSGSGSLTKSGSGTLTLTSNSTSNGWAPYSGGTTITAGTLQIGNGGSTGTLGSGDIINNGTLIFNRTSDITVTDAISGTGDLIKLASGTLILSGGNTYTGATTVTDGTLINNGTLASAVTVQSGATLGGSGTFNDLVTFSSGAHLAPGNSPDTLTFANGLALSSGTIIDFELGQPGVMGGALNDLIVVSGGALSGPTDVGGLTFNLIDSGGFTAGTYTLFDYNSGATLSNFDLTDFTLGTSVAGYTYSFAFNGNTLQLTATAVPEPATYAVFAGLFFLAVAAWRRRVSS